MHATQLEGRFVGSDAADLVEGMAGDAVPLRGFLSCGGAHGG